MALLFLELDPAVPAKDPAMGPRFSFENGALEIGYRAEKRRVRAWPDPHAIVDYGSGDWEPFWPRFRLLHPATPANAPPPAVDGPAEARTEEKRAAYQSLRETVPAEVAAALEGFPNHQWAMLELAHACPAYLDLVESNPALAFAVANNQEFRTLTARSPATQAKWHIHKTQRDLLAWLGFPPTKAAVKLLRRIHASALTPWDLRLLRAALERKGPALKLLSHLPRINAGALRLCIVRAIEEALTPSLIEEVASSGEEDVYPYTADLLSEAAFHLADIERGARLPRQRSRREAQDYGRRIRERHDFLRVNQKALEKYGPWFPRPPVPGTRHIRPIQCRHELKREAAGQRNCVLSHEYSVVKAETYVYKVLKPERATLEIARRADGAWAIKELKRKGNTKASPTTHYAVEQWLAGHRLGL